MSEMVSSEGMIFVLGKMQEKHEKEVAELNARLSSARELVEKLMVIIKTQSCDGCNPTGRMGAVATEICTHAEQWLKENK